MKPSCALPFGGSLMTNEGWVYRCVDVGCAMRLQCWKDRG